MTKNDDNVLPLINVHQTALSKPLKLLVTGPTSDSLSFQTGGWTGQWQGVNSNKEREWFTMNEYKTVRQALQDETDTFDVKYECGVDILGNDCDNNLGERDSNDGGKQNKNLLDVVRGWIHGGSNDSSSSSVVSSDTLDAIVVCLGEELVVN